MQRLKDMKPNLGITQTRIQLDKSFLVDQL